MKYIARGNIHIHSNLSDGTSSIEEIAEDANKAGLDFIVINDHEHLRGKEMGLEGFYGDTLVLVGQEVNRVKNHYLVLGLDEVIQNNEENPKEIISEVKEKGGIGIIAHPYENGSPLVNNGRTFPWTDFDLEGFDGMEVSNYSSEWRDGAKTLLHAVYANFINDLAYIRSPNPKSYAKWKELTKKKKVTGIIGSDAHAPIFKVGPFKFKILSYKYLFSSGNNYIYLDTPLHEFKKNNDVKNAREALLKAIKKGNLYICYDRIEKGDGLLVYLKDNKDNIYLPGDFVPQGRYDLFVGFDGGRKDKSASLLIESYEGIQIFKLPVEEKLYLKKGTYNLHLSHKKHKNWIIINPFYVK
ncbi:PHP domain-containing protein [Natranaerofaba carboxydovora]|uniref:PHP domain-containing protein n=1 Tax=Natranaerofaba carboxydovora TaxID=2742683 RepID=UPI001F1458E3|nr:CehA/McbA family metallohydrolase [Natranaerofaba carboxydovora]UMZ75089.1 hypothetical protein ACONDI_02701 [Natranaerofaba carboxydovora]